MRIKKIGVLSLGYALAIFFAIASLLQIILVIMQTKIPALAQQMNPTVVAVLNQYGLWAVLLSPVIGLISGFVSGVVAACIYNWIVAKITGGLKIEFSEEKKK